MSTKKLVIEQLQKLRDAPDTSPHDRFAARAAAMILTGDLDAASQAIEALRIPQAEWDKVAAGTFNYDAEE